MPNDAQHILNNYIPMAKTIAEMFGSQCEVVLHDLTQPQSSVIFTVNNHVTGRQIGQSFDHLVKQVILSENFKEDYLAGYPIKAADNRVIKSSTTIIRDLEQKVIGALCINYDVNQMVQMRNMLEELLPKQHINQNPKVKKQEDSIQNVEDITNQLIEQIVANTPQPLVKRREKIELIKFMDEKGIFLMKGAVEKVAEQLGISKVTVYSYLDEVKKGK